MMTRLKVVALATLAFSSLTAMKPAAAALFSKADLDPNKLILVASPYGNNAHQLLIVEQVSNSRACWSEGGSSPTVVEPLLANFDFTGICGRSTDANGYSIRMGDQDLGLQYSLRVVQRDGDLLLMGVPNSVRNAPEIPIGRAGGMTNGFAKLSLNPGWRITRRVYNNQPLGHFYLTNDQPLDSAIAASPVQPASLPLPATRTPLPLPVSRPEIVITPGSSTPSLFPQPATTSIAIPVPPPESAAATGSTLPRAAARSLPASNASASSASASNASASNASGTIPVITVPAKVSVAAKKPAAAQKPGSKTAKRTTTASRSSNPRSFSKGKPIRTPVPAAATRPIVSAPSEAMPQSIIQPPAMPTPMPQPAASQPAVSQPTVMPLPRAVKPGDFVVPTTTF